MKLCPKCGEEVEDTSVFCQDCGYKLDSNHQIIQTENQENSFETKKLNAMVIFGYLTILVQLIAIFAAWSQVKVINSDRLILYPLLAVMLTFFAAFNLVQNEKTYIHSIIIAVVSVLLFFFGIVVV